AVGRGEVGEEEGRGVGATGGGGGEGDGEPGHGRGIEAVVGGVVGAHRRGEPGAEGVPGDGGGAVGPHRHAGGKVGVGAAEERGGGEGAPVGGEPGHERVIEAVEGGVVGAWGRGEAGAIGLPGDGGGA